MKRTLLFAAAVVLVCAFPVFAAEQEKPEGRPGGSMVQASSITATVESIDYDTRMVTLKGPEGNTVTLRVGEVARNFNQVRKGDKVTFDYYESIAVDVQKSSGQPHAVESQTITRGKPGERPGGKIETTGSMTAKVEKIDYKSRMVTVKLADGSTMSFKAGDQVKRLNEITTGDEVVVQYTQAVAISVKTPKKSK